MPVFFEDYIDSHKQIGSKRRSRQNRDLVCEKKDVPERVAKCDVVAYGSGEGVCCADMVLSCQC